MPVMAEPREWAAGDEGDGEGEQGDGIGKAWEIDPGAALILAPQRWQWGGGGVCL